jgi:hypothetical protein
MLPSKHCGGGRCLAPSAAALSLAAFVFPLPGVQARLAAQAVPPSQIAPLVGYGDTQVISPWLPPSDALHGLPACGGAVPKEPSFTQALTDAQGLFSGPAARGEKALSVATYSGTADAAEVFAAGTAIGDAPLAGLAALLDARVKSPSDPMLVVNASVFLTELGHPADALAFLDEAAKLGSPNAAPLGLSDTAVELDDRGFALIGMHKYAAAIPVLQAASRAGGPLLSEASVNEAAALNCAGESHQAFAALVAGAYRQNYDMIDEGPPEKPGDTEQPDTAQLGFTRPEGPPDTLPVLKYPQTPEESAAAVEGFENYADYLSKVALALQKLVNAQTSELYAQLVHASPVTRLRTWGILTLVGDGGAGQAPVEQADNAAVTAEGNEHEWQLQFGGQAPKPVCPYQGHWLSLMQTEDTAFRAEVAALSRFEAPLIASLGNPLAHQIALEEVQIVDDNVLVVLAEGVSNWGGLAAECVSRSAFAAPADKEAKVGDPGECPPEEGPDQKLVFKIPGLVDVKVNCESVEVSVEGEELISPFATGETNAHGETTVFGGAKAGVNLGVISGELQEGFYVKSGPNGIEDWGVRISPTASAGTGTVQMEYGSDVNISLVGSIEYIPTAFGFN